MNPQRTRFVLWLLAALSMLLLFVPSPTATQAEDEEPPLFEMTDPEEIDAVASAPAPSDPQTAEAGVPPLIDVWHGTSQVFGHLGHPQQWINIVGRVSDGNGVQSLKYTLNGGRQQSLSIGPDRRRLAFKGDFNLDIDRNRLNPGHNEVIIIAQDRQGNTSSETVAVTYMPGSVWPLRYSIDWSEVSDIQDVAQVVDGVWKITADGIRTEAPGYDRLVAIGDLAWTDYQVKVPVTVHSLMSSGSPGVGILMRWKGHTDSPVSGWQPKSGWYPLGALGWYRWFDSGDKNLRIDGNQKRLVAITRNKKLKLNTRYYLKMQVETRHGKGGYYRLKLWEASQPEPSGWDLKGQEALNDPQKGSFLLLAHQADVTFGDVQVSPVGNVHTLAIDTVGQGTVSKEANAAAYADGEVVRLTPLPAPGWLFDGWSGADAEDLADNGDGTWSLQMMQDRSITATFSPGCYSLTVDFGPGGAGSVAPSLPPNCANGGYAGGTQVSFTALPAAGYTLGHWSGTPSGRANPTMLVVTGETTVNANFVKSAAVYEASFEGYEVGVDPDGWFDTAANNSMVLDDSLFQVQDVGGSMVLGTQSTKSNIHTHYVRTGSEGWSAYRYWGRMMMTASTGGLGVTFYSQYADKDVYYRLRRYGSSSFHLAPHPHSTVRLSGKVDTGVRPQPGLWYWFLVEVENTGTRTEIRAKVWPQGAAEAEDWQVDAWHSGGERLTRGRIGVWSYGPGGKYWDDLLMQPVTLPQSWNLEVTTVGQGNVWLAPDQQRYANGQEVVLTATASTGWRFTGWSGAVTGHETSIKLTMDADKLVSAAFEKEAELYAEDFEGYAAGDDPIGWRDTRAGNSMAEDSGLFKVYEINGTKAFGTKSVQTNIHTHYEGGSSDGWSNYRYQGRMMMTSRTSGLGVTFYSQYADHDLYYRLRRYGSNSFHLAPHLHQSLALAGDLDTGVKPEPNVWYRFVVEVENQGAQTNIRANVWPEGSTEPGEWQVNAWHSGSGRLIGGRIGFWSYSLGAKYWDDLLVEPY